MQVSSSKPNFFLSVFNSTKTFEKKKEIVFTVTSLKKSRLLLSLSPNEIWEKKFFMPDISDFLTLSSFCPLLKNFR